MDDSGNIYLIGDTHFGHKGIIGMCSRPFSNPAKMNRYMIRRWNETVKAGNTVYFLGDMAHGRRAGAANTWKKSLNGNIIHIAGNHDKTGDGFPFLIREWQGIRFLLIHDPARERLPFPWDDWIIHGHKHNNDLKDFPFINREKKTINVSAEVIDYKPVKLDYVLSLVSRDIQ